MLPLKRLEEIKKILTENKQADVISLAQTLNAVSYTHLTLPTIGG